MQKVPENVTEHLAKADKGTQDYSGYFGSDLTMQRFDLVPRVDP